MHFAKVTPLSGPSRRRRTEGREGGGYDSRVGRADIVTIRVPKWATVLLLLAVSAAMAGVIYMLSGRAYEPERASAIDFILRLRRQVGKPLLLATMAPLILDLLFFVPFGAVAFLALDRAGQPRKRSYAATMAVGVAFALGLLGWQAMLPTRVTGWVDALWNVAGCFAGALLGHARKEMHIRFE